MSYDAFKIRVRGRVTGVCFRMSACDYARRFPGLRGYVRNSGISEVESVVQGEPDAVDAMIKWFGHGPSYAQVDSIDVVEDVVDPNLPLYRITY